MDFAGINYWAVIVATVASFLFGGVWYGVFSKQWMAATGMSEEKIAAQSKEQKVPWAFIIAAAAQLVMAFMLAGTIGHLGTGQVTISNSLITAVFIWVGFVATTLTVNHSFQDQPRTLTLIDGGHWLGVLLIQGLIIGSMGV